MVKLLKGREVAFLESKLKRQTELETHSGERGFKAHSIDYLKTHFENYNFLRKNWDLYYSLASFYDLPQFSYSPEKRKIQRKEFFQETFNQYWEKYDFVIDIDADKIQDAYNSAKKVKSIFDEFGLVYSLKFSGLHGFHFVVRDEMIFKDIPLENRVDLSRTIAKNIEGIENINNIDTGIYQRDRLIKLPYSLVGQNVVLPLSDKDFDNFELDHIKLPHVIKFQHIKGRGMLERMPKDINISEFIKIYGGV